jgi:hypothetical protein
MTVLLAEAFAPPELPATPGVGARRSRARRSATPPGVATVRPLVDPDRNTDLDLDGSDGSLALPIEVPTAAPAPDYEDIDDVETAGYVSTPAPPASPRRGRGVARLGGDSGARVEAQLGRRFLDRSLRKLR